jgi:glycosyltransferase involved in cell wall biosynthesis
MAQNLIPFAPSELRNIGWTRDRIRPEILRRTQSATFRRANGVLFPSEFSRSEVVRQCGTKLSNTAAIPHGLNSRFRLRPRNQKPISAYSTNSPFRLLMVSTVAVYKHQWFLVDAVADLVQAGMPLDLTLVGGSTPASLARLKKSMATRDPDGRFIHYHGEVPFDLLHNLYAGADAFVFTSTCESFGQIILEAMASGLPIACSNHSAIPEVLGNGGLYFDPLNEDDMRAALVRLVNDKPLREDLAAAAFARSEEFSWSACADLTFDFLRRTAATYHGHESSRGNVDGTMLLNPDR